METTACFITGHRPTRFKFAYNENDALCKKIKNALCGQIKAQYDNGIRKIWVGGAMGVDTWAGEIVLELQKQDAYRDLELFAAIPFPAHGEKFYPNQRQRYQRILDGCTGVTVVCPEYDAQSFRKRDYFMVDQCCRGIAVYDGLRSMRSGTKMTVNYAVNKKRLPMTYIHPDTADVTTCIDG